MIIWGTKGRQKEISSGEFHCPQCDAVRPYKLKHAGRYFTLYFIPIFETQNLGDFVECQHCQQTFKPEILNHRPPSKAERLILGLRQDLESGLPLHMARQKALGLGAAEAEADRIVAAAAGENPVTCPKCAFVYRNTIATCPNCGTRLYI